MNWCKHIKGYSNNGTNLRDEWIITGEEGEWLGKTYGEPNFCPICGTPRPSEPKKLADKLSDAYGEVGANHERSAKVAISHVLGVVKEVSKEMDFKCDTFKAFESSLIKKLKEEGEA